MTSNQDRLDTALWWVQRWISGSMNDPDWTFEEAEAMGIEAAFDLVQSEIGNSRSTNGPVWRYLAVSEAEARRLEAELTLLPHEFPFQSFTTSARLAEEIGEELSRAGDVNLLVCAQPPMQDVMFGLADLMADKRSKSTMLALGDWHNQKEVVVRVKVPLKILESRRMEPMDPALGGLPPMSF